ncbi:phosphonate C-P lyase system protein PhnH [Salinibius halmophilus]|uniref:phosphonate C-P lyase system protein PhnH n=1 Tax=Salinibius halmophilus TaxID=1853216 RepID=UPI000E6658E9|nr:phosphonate C-P lyase system protein PhnH [Salinibius halmophilus]
MNHITASFSDPVHSAQQSFRTLLTAIAEPGTIHGLDQGMQFAPLGASLTAATLTLCDNTTSVYLSHALNQESVRANLVFHCGCTLVAEPYLADFALLTLAEFTNMREFKIGDEAQPQLNCTFFVQVDTFGQGTHLHLQGPGIQTTRQLAIAKLTDAQVAMLQVNHQQFPLGYDTFFFSKTQVCALARSTQVDKEAVCTSQ